MGFRRGADVGTVVAAPLDLPRLLAETFLASAEHHAVLSSTNDHARHLAASATIELPYLVSADQQTAGRGRGANRWWTPEGSLAFSLLIDAASARIAREHIGLVSLAAAAAIVKTVQTRLSDHRVGLHWPNDVYIDRRKLAGILVESLPSGRLVLGIGINVNNELSSAPPEVRELATSLCDVTGHVQDRTQLLIDLLNQLQCELSLLATDPYAIGRQAHNFCLQCGEPLTIDSGQETVSGSCMGIEPDGALLIMTGGGPRKFYAGVLRRSAPN